MYYSFDITCPTGIESIDDYKERLREIINGQIKNVFLKERFINPFFWLFALLFIPMSIVYLAGCILEIMIDTLLLPFFCVPYLRCVAIIISSIVFGFGVAVGIFALVPLTYDLPHAIKPLDEKQEQFLKYKRNILIVAILNFLEKSYQHFGQENRFNDDMDVLYENFETIIKKTEQSVGVKKFYSTDGKVTREIILRRCSAVGYYLLFDLTILNYPYEEVIRAIIQIINNEECKAVTFFDSVSWFDVRLTFIDKVKFHLE